jgi:hypothetical protein
MTTPKDPNDIPPPSDPAAAPDEADFVVTSGQTMCVYDEYGRQEIWSHTPEGSRRIFPKRNRRKPPSSPPETEE